MLQKMKYKKVIFAMWVALCCIWIGLAVSLIQITVYAPLQFMIVTTGMLVLFIGGMHIGRRLKWGIFNNSHFWSVYFLAFYAYELHVITELFEYSGYIYTMWKKYAICISMYFTLLLLVYAVSNRFIITVSICTVFFVLLGILNFALDQFRGKVLYFDDLFSIKTALSVAGNYQIKITAGFIWTMLLAVVSFVLPIICRQAYDIVDEKKKFHLLRLSEILFIAIIWYIYIGTGFLDSVTPNYWRAANNGYILNFIQQAKGYYSPAGANYNLDEIEELSKLYKADSNVNSNLPNVIVIMNESFSDLRVLGDLRTDKAVMPNFDAIRENVIKGYSYVSIRGGNTPNSEYEFLTQNSLAQFSAGAVPFQMNYIYDGIPNLAGRFKSLGYTTIAAHPFERMNWNRESVYENMQFDEQYFIEDFENAAYLRSAVSDEGNYDFLINYFENHLTDEPLFIHNVTMQNHGGYDSVPEGIGKVSLVDYTQEYPQTEVYLTLIRESDRAFAKFINYFKEQEKPTVVCFFGDHQPMTENGFLEEIYQKNLGDLTLEEQQRMYMVPFMIWANFDIEENEIETTSLNYLGSILCEETGIPLTAYQKYLLQLRNEIPAINAFGWQDKEGNWHGFNDQNDGISEYQNVMYHQIYDRENLVEEFFQ